MASKADVKPVNIVVDSAESTSGIPRRLASVPGVTIEVQRLESGDYLPAPHVAVERKTGNDFVHSILDGRLLPQVELLTARFDRVIILVEGGDVHNSRSGISEVALQGALSWISVLKGASVMYSRDAADTAGLVHRMAVQAQHGLGYDIPLRAGKPRPDDIGLLVQFLIEGLPGVGPGKARALIQHFGSARAVLTASEAELAAAPGMGAKTAEKILKVLLAKV